MIASDAAGKPLVDPMTGLMEPRTLVGDRGLYDEGKERKAAKEAEKHGRRGTKLYRNPTVKGKRAEGSRMGDRRSSQAGQSLRSTTLRQRDDGASHYGGSS